MCACLCMSHPVLFVAVAATSSGGRGPPETFLAALLCSNFASVCDQSVEDSSAAIEEADVHGKQPRSMRRETQAGIISSDDCGDAIQHALREFRSIDEVLGDLLHTAADREIIMSGGHDQIGPGNGSVLVHLVVMNQSSAGG